MVTLYADETIQLKAMNWHTDKKIKSQNIFC